MTRTIRSFAVAAVVLALAACSDVPTAAPAPDVQARASSFAKLGEIEINAVEEYEDYWYVDFTTAVDFSIASRTWQHLPPVVSASPWGNSAYRYSVIRYKKDGPGCVEVSLTTNFTNGTSKWRSEAVYVGGIIATCSAVSW